MISNFECLLTYLPLLYTQALLLSLLSPNHSPYHCHRSCRSIALYPLKWKALLTASPLGVGASVSKSSPAKSPPLSFVLVFCFTRGARFPQA